MNLEQQGMPTMGGPQSVATEGMMPPRASPPNPPPEQIDPNKELARHPLQMIEKVNIAEELSDIELAEIGSEAKKGFDLMGFIDDSIDSIKELQGDWSGASKSEQASIHSQAQSIRHTIAGTIDKKGQGSGYSYDCKRRHAPRNNWYF